MNSYPIKLKIEPVIKEWLINQKGYKEPYNLSKHDAIGVFLYTILKDSTDANRYKHRELASLSDEYQIRLPKGFAVRHLQKINNAASCKFNNFIKHMFFNEFELFMKRELKEEFSPKGAVRKFIDEYNLMDLINEARLIKHYQRHIGTSRKNKRRK